MIDNCLKTFPEPSGEVSAAVGKCGVPLNVCNVLNIKVNLVGDTGVEPVTPAV
jgi:hypothetical protein